MLMLPGILLVTLSSPFLISLRTPTTTGIVSVFVLHPIDFNFPIPVIGKLLCEFC